VLIIVGSLAPWVQVSSPFGTITLNGTDGDGQLTVVGGILVLVALIVQKYLASAIVAGVTGAGLAYDLVNINRNVPTPPVVGVL
jgi:hypothetical protein